MNWTKLLDAPVENVVVCHPEPLIASATAIALQRSGTVRSATVTHTLTSLLSCLDSSVQVAVVFDSVDEDIVELFEALRHRKLATPVVIVSRDPTPERSAEAIELGAWEVLPDNCASSTLRDCVITAHNGQPSCISIHQPEIVDALRARQLRRHQARRRLARLSESERQALCSLIDGASVPAIAERMSVSPHTVRSYIRRLGTKLDVNGQLRIAATGRLLLAAARMPCEDNELVTSGESA